MGKIMQKVLSSHHHKNVLSNLFEFIHLEHLTDTTFLCQNAQPVHAHRKVLVQISPILRKIAHSRPKEERLVIVIDVSSFLNMQKGFLNHSFLGRPHGVIGRVPILGLQGRSAGRPRNRHHGCQ